MRKTALACTLLCACSGSAADFDAAVSPPDAVIVADATPCLSLDRDGDGLRDCIESGSNIFRGLGDTGTDPDDPDSDGDGISDGDEVLGTARGLDLPAMGAHPLQRDIFIEMDWIADQGDSSCSGAGASPHDHRPTAAMIDRVVQMFADAPTTNPDGTTGIRMHIDVGQGGAFTGGDVIPASTCSSLPVGSCTNLRSGGGTTFFSSGTDYRAIKLAHFDDNRTRIFHYSIAGHRYSGTRSSGIAEIRGDDFVVTLGCAFEDELKVAGTIAHELGHNLALRHGGFSNCNYKPNYNSIMSYAHQFEGIDEDCDSVGDGQVISYSSGTNIDLDENNLSEPEGVCGNVPIDWNDNGDATETGISFNVNPVDDMSCPGRGRLADHDDWGTIGIPLLFQATAPPTVTCADL